VNRLGGADGNERLSIALGVPLVALLGVEVLTTLDLPSYLSVHMFLGLVVLPVVSLKIASTSWRALRYYTGSSDYARLGTPQLVLRVLAPPLVIVTVVLFGSGVAFFAVHATHPLRTIHTFAFVAWGVIMVIHVVAYMPRVARDGFADWRRRRSLAGGVSRRALVVGAPLAGIALALATYSLQTSWLHSHRSSSPPAYPGDDPCPTKGAAIQRHDDEDQTSLQRGALVVRQERHGESELHRVDRNRDRRERDIQRSVSGAAREVSGPLCPRYQPSGGQQADDCHCEA
jgi:hypothetical protein